MAEGFEAYHVPQQSRRDKLRGLADDHNNNLNLQNYATAAGLVSFYDPSSIVYMDPQSSSASHIVPFQDFNSNPFLYTPQNPRFLDHTQLVAHNNTTNGQGLSLSLSSLHHNNTPTTNELSNSSCVPLGPFTGYSVILKRSRFLKPAQLLLEEICDNMGKGIYGRNLADDDMDPLLAPHEINILDRQGTSSSNGDEHGTKKSRLISMLDEVYQKYKQYHQQLQMVVASFESVAGLGNAAPFANLALKAMSKHFKCLKDAITDQLQFTTSKSSSLAQIDPIPRVGIPGKGLYCQRPEIQNQPVWRPQRGLPERAVTVLRAWLFDHFLHPYPTDTDKVMLAKQTGLSRNQVSNWFINARVRLWKPMVEEIHSLETKEAHNKSSQRDRQNSNNDPIEHNSHVCDTPSTSAPRIQDIPSKRTRNDLPNIPMGGASSMNLSYGNLTTGSGGVSLTLGLHQNTGIRLSEPFPINAALRFGIDANSHHDRFMIGGFEEQNGQFGRNMIGGGQFLHDFAG